MVNYYEKFYGDLYPGHIAKSSDIMNIQQNIEDAIKNVVKDFTEGESWILGTNDQSDQNAFILTPESKRNGRYIDQMNLAEENDVEILSFREMSYRQPIKMGRSSIYSIIVKLQNKSEKTVPVFFELRNAEGELIPNMRTKLNLPKETNTPTEFEIVFDLNHYPTAHGLDSEELEDGNTNLAQVNTDESSSEAGPDYGDEEELANFTAGATIVYFHIEALNKNKLEGFDVNTVQSNNYKWNDEDPTFGIVINKNSTYGQLLEESPGNEFTLSSIRGDLYFKDIYANAPTYRCNPGQAIIGGEKVILMDTHISVGGASGEGDVLSYIYMDTSGFLQFINSNPTTGNVEEQTIEGLGDHLHIANIITYMDNAKDPVIQQSDDLGEYGSRQGIFRPRSHHERIRRLEKKLSYTQEIAIPPRIKYTRTGKDWIDEYPNVDFTSDHYKPLAAQDLDALNSQQYAITTDANGNFIVKLNKAESFSIPITLKNEKSGKITTEKDKTKLISTAQAESYFNDLAADDETRAQIFAEMKNMSNDFTKGELTLSVTSKESVNVATTAKEAKETEFNPWDDAKANRPKQGDIKPTTRSYTVVKGKNGAHDWASQFPAMTLYTDTGIVLKKLEIPIYKFKNCESVKFLIYERQGPNNKKNTVWLKQRKHVTKPFSLKNAKVKKGYQYVENGFTIDFGKKGLELSKGQYVIICLPIPKSGRGTVYVDTYKPENSRDFCIRYYGAGNASHFLLKDKYQEVWYNPAKAIGENITYSKSGEVVSGVISWKNKEAIKTIKPLANLEIPKGTTAKIYADVGGGWIELNKDKDNSVIGSGTGESFRWKIKFTGNSKASPILSYDKKKGYAIKFEITRAVPDTNTNAGAQLDKNMCFTSKPFDANDILREYLGDYNIGLSDNKFSNFEFARVWGTDSPILIDISGSDRIEEVTGPNSEKLYFPLYSLHYVDLSLNDFSQDSVDYSNYDAFLEEDEYNLRLKLDTENSYNDENIKVIPAEAFSPTDTNFVDEGETAINLTKIPTSENNQIIAKARFSNPIDLSKYAAIRANFTLTGEAEGTISGLGLYISSRVETEAPTTLPSEDLDAALVDDLPDLNASQTETIETYANKIIRNSYNNNGAGYDVYYKCVWNSKEGKWEWQQLHDVKSYNIYELSDRKTKTEVLTLSDTTQEIQCDIEIDPNSVNLQFVKEIGIVLLNDSQKYVKTNVNTFAINSFDAIKQDYYPVFDPKTNVFEAATARSPVVCKANGSMDIGSQHITATNPETSSIAITHQSVLAEGEDLCSFDLTSQSTSNFNHIGVQIATDCYLTKHMLQLHFRKVDKDGNETTIEKIGLPTLNHIYYPTTAEKSINLTQVFKKIKTSDRFDKVVLYATPKFKKYAEQLKSNLGTTITLYIGKISLYRAKTIPMFHPVMRMKIYLDDMSDMEQDKMGIRKVGAILDYQ